MQLVPMIRWLAYRSVLVLLAIYWCCGTGLAQVPSPRSIEEVLAGLKAKVLVAEDLPERPIVSVDLWWRDGGEALLRVSELPALRSLKIGHGVTDEDLRRLNQMEHLEELWIGGRSITDRGLGDVALVRGLRDLRIRHAGITDKGLEQLHGLPKLETLSLIIVPLSADGLRAVAGIPNVRALQLSFVACTNADFAALGALGNLRSLLLGMDLLGDDVLDSLTHLVKLEELHLGACELAITAPGLRKLADLPSLRRLELHSASGVAEDVLRHVDDLRALKVLECGGLAIDAWTFTQLEKLEHLEELTVHRSRVSLESARAIGRLQKLRTLALIDCKIGNAEARALAALRELESLDLSSNPISDAGAEEFKKMSRLRKLNLADTSVSAEVLKELREELRGATVGAGIADQLGN